MLARDIKTGSTYLAKISGTLCRVTITGRDHIVAKWLAKNERTGRTVRLSSGKLRPVPGSDLERAEADRKARSAGRRLPRPFVGPAGTVTVQAAPVAEMLGNVSSGPVLALSASNKAAVGRIVDAIHVAEPFGYVARRVRRSIGRAVIWATIPRSLRRGLLYAAAKRHAAGRQLYRDVMQQEPAPTSRMLAERIGQAFQIPTPRA